MKQNSQIKYFLYARKSTEDEDRQVLSIDSQIDELKQLATGNGLDIIEVFTESKSAKAPGRPVFSKMMERILYSGEGQGVLCWKLDRLARNPVDGGQISWALQQGIIQHIQTFDRSYLPSDNVLMMSVEFGMANQFVRDLSVGVKRGLKRKVEMGWGSGVAPAGYLNTPDREKGFKIVVKDPERFSIIRKMWNMVLTGKYTVQQVLDTANSEWGYTTVKRRKEGGGPLSRSGLYRLLTNSYYAGVIIFNGNEYQGAHEPMITMEEYDRVQEILGRKGKPRPKKHSFPYSGMIRCLDCKRVLTPERKVKKQKNGNVHEYVFYSCKNRKCFQKGIEVKSLENQIGEILGTIELPGEFHDWAMDVIRQENEKEWRGREVILSNLQRQYNTCAKKIDGLIDMRASGELTEEEYAPKKSAALKEKERLATLLNDADSRINRWVDTVDKALTFAERARAVFLNGDSEKKKDILYSLGSNLLVKDKKLFIHGENIALQFKRVSPQVKAICEMFEPAELLSIERKNRAFDPVRSTWLPLFNDLRTFFKENPLSD